MKHLSLSEYLTVDNPWTARLLGTETFQKKRDAEQIIREYNKNKWGVLLQRELYNVEHAKTVELEILAGQNWRTAPTPFSLGDEIFETTGATCLSMYFSMIRSRFKNYKADFYCELGCAYGYNLALFDRPGYGGEFTEAGITVGRRLGISVEQFDFYNCDSYRFIRPRSVVFTVQALEQIPDASAFLEGMRSQRDRVDAVLHLEPSFISERRDLFGLLRNRYLEINDYNRNLVTLLQQAADVELLEFDRDYFGSPPLNSLHFIAWHFK